MSIYLDTSVLVPLFMPNPFSARADAFLRSVTVPSIVGDFAAAELASVVARRVRTREFTPDQARAVFTSFDAWVARLGPRTGTEVADIISTEGLLRRLDLPLRTPDALHLALVQRLGVTIATFDGQLKTGAIAIGVPVAML